MNTPVPGWVFLTVTIWLLGLWFLALIGNPYPHVVIWFIGLAVFGSAMGIVAGQLEHR